MFVFFAIQLVSNNQLFFRFPRYKNSVESCKMWCRWDSLETINWTKSTCTNTPRDTSVIEFWKNPCSKQRKSWGLYSLLVVERSIPTTKEAFIRRGEWWNANKCFYTSAMFVRDDQNGTDRWWLTSKTPSAVWNISS